MAKYAPHKDRRSGAIFFLISTRGEMKEKIMKFLGQKWVREIAIIVASAVIAQGLCLLIFKLNVFGLIIKLLVKLHLLKVPGSVLIIIIVLCIALLILALKRHPRSGTSTAKPIDIESELRRLTFNDGHWLVLSRLAVAKDAVKNENLFKDYLARNPEKSRLDFRLIIDDLLREKFIEYGSFMSFETEYILSNDGLAFLRRIKERDQRTTKKE